MTSADQSKMTVGYQSETEHSVHHLSTLSLNNHEREKWVCLFQARQQDLKLSNQLDLQFSRFMTTINKQPPHKLVLKDQGFGQISARVLSKILEARTDLTHIDFSLNNLGQGLEHLIRSFS